MYLYLEQTVSNMKFGLVFFYSDATVAVVKQSRCIIRDGFSDGKDVEIKCKGTSYLALILRTNGKFFVP